MTTRAMSGTQRHMLSGYRLLDLTRAVAGPTCTRMFAEMGAEVIKVEAAPDGDMARHISQVEGNRSLYLVQQSLNKKSLCLDWRKPEAIDVLRELVPHCDVVVENFRPGIIDEMGLGYDRLRELREDVILCSISALGQSGPLAQKPGYDFIAQAYAGITSMIGPPDGPPSIPLAAIGDASTGATAAFAIAAALLDRHATGGGQHLDVAILDCYYHYHEVNVHHASRGIMEPHRGGSHMAYVCPAGAFRASGGYVIIMGFLQHWPDMCAAMGRPERVSDPAWATDAARLARKDDVIADIEAWLRGFPDLDSAIAVLEEHGVPCAPVLSVRETLTHPHLVERGTVREIDDPIAGTFQAPGHPVRSSRYPVHPGYVAPKLGEHNREVLGTLLGYDGVRLDALAAAGVLHDKPY